MKLKKIMTLAFIALPSCLFAQLNGDGFYRVQNVATERYISVLDESPSYTNVNKIYTFNSLMTESWDKAKSDPSTIMYIQEIGNNEYSIQSQGIDTKEVTGVGLKLKKNSNGTYGAYGEQNGAAIYLGDSETEGSHLKGGDGSNMKAQNQWYIKAIGANNCLCVVPTVEYNGKYYTTLYTAFAYSLPSTIKAYYVSSLSTSAVEISQIEGNIVPAETAIILECESNIAEQNVITPTTDTGVDIAENHMKGAMFNYGDNRIDYSLSTMRMLGIDNGKLAFVTSNLDYIPANTGFLFGRKITMAASYEVNIPGTSAINNVNASNAHKDIMVNIAGLRVDNNAKGIVIINGKKVLK